MYQQKQTVQTSIKNYSSVQNSKPHRIQQQYFNQASSTIARPTEALSSNLLINNVQPYGGAKSNSHLLSITGNPKLLQNRFTSQHNNTPIATMQPIENASVLRRFENRSFTFTPRLQENLTAPKNFQEAKGLENKSVTIKNGGLSDNAKNSFPNSIKKNYDPNIRLLTGTAEKIIKWYKILKNEFCFYELIAPIVSVQEGTVRQQKMLILKDRRGPIMQIIYYSNDHISTDQPVIGQIIRCVGHMIGPNIMHGLSIREARAEEITTLSRMCYISEHAITK